jgi:hypothetical protein
MPRSRVDYLGEQTNYLGRQTTHLGAVEALGEKAAIAEAAKQFNITPARRNRIAVMRIAAPKREQQ